MHQLQPTSVMVACDRFQSSFYESIRCIRNGDLARRLTDVEMQNLVAEEFGHALGLGHSNIEGDLMFGFHVSGEKILCHSTLNIYGLAVLYGYTHESGATSMHRQVVTLRETSIPYSSVDSLEH